MSDTHSDSDSGGQVSEVSAMDPAAADTPIQPDQSVAGAPDEGHDRPDEGPQGPNANPNEGARLSNPGRQRD